MNKEHNLDPAETAEVVSLTTAANTLPIAVLKDGTQINPGAATAQQMRVMEVSEALAPAYAKASTLQLTEAEINGLMLPFPDEKVEVRPHDGLIYIPHIHISNRLNAVFNPGLWSLICRRHWIEGGTMYGEYILLIKGCYVGESVGGHQYQPNNPKVNYSDTLESTAAEALRRIAGKRLSCGSQVWDPDYAEKWCAKYRGCQNGKYFKKVASPPPTTPPPVRTFKEKLDKFITEATKVAPVEQVQQFLIDLAWLLPNESIGQLEERYLPKTEKEMKQFKSCLENWTAKGDTVQPYDCPLPEPQNVPRGTKKVEVPRENVDKPEEAEEWRTFPFPFGKNAGVNLEDMEKGQLWYWWNEYKVEESFEKDGVVKKKKPETVAKDRKLRAMLDQAGEHYGFKPKD